MDKKKSDEAAVRTTKKVSPTRCHQRTHIAEEQGGQQAADVGAIGVRIRHENDLAVAGSIDIEATSRPGPHHLDDGGALGVAQHVRLGGLLDVEDLAADGQQRLESL